jgi:hypothetical protein
MFRTWILGLCVAVISLAAIPTLAQQTTGTVVGTVQDPSGAVLPGVSVLLTGERVMGTRTSVTDDRGRYSIGSLPPGSYDLTYVISGFGTAKRTQVRVQVGATIEINVSLKVQGLSEAVDVEASKAVVDTQSSQVNVHYDRAWIDNSPTTRTSFFDILANAPGVDPSSLDQNSDPTSFGSMVDQNQYQLDGIDVTDSFNGKPTTLVKPSVDAVEQVEILSLGAPAEYGSFQGGVFNVVTRQGTNQFHGGAAFYYQSQGLTGRNTTAAEDGGFPFNRVEYKNATAQLGGPIVKDKLWFFAAYEYLRDSSAVDIAPQDANLNNYDHVFGKLNFQINSNNNIVTSYNHDYWLLNLPLLPLQAPSTQTGEARNVDTVGATYTSILSNRTVLELSYAGFYVDHKEGTVNGGNKSIGTDFQNLDTGALTGPPTSWYEYHVSRTTLTAKLTHHSSDFLGAGHDFKFGAQYNNAPMLGTYGINNRIYTGATLHGYGFQYTPYTYGGVARTVGGFVEDDVKVNSRLNLNLGVRYDHTHTASSSEPQLDGNGSPTGTVFRGVDYYTWNSISPRIGFNLKLTSDGKTVLKGHYGRYYRGGTTGEFATAVPSVSASYYGMYDFATNTFENLQLVSSNSNLTMDPNLKDPRTDQFVLGAERQLFNDLNVSTTFVYKRSRDFPGWADVGGQYLGIPYVDNIGPGATGNTFTVYQLQPGSNRSFLLTSPPGTKSDVEAFNVSATKRMSKNWQLTSSLDLTHSTGDLISGQYATLNFRSFGQNPNDYVNSDGLLAYDRAYVFKTQLLYTGLPGGFTVGVNYFYADGYPMRRTIFIPATNLPKYVQTAPLTSDIRFPNLNELDFRVQKDIHLGGSVRVHALANVFNIFNSGAYQETQNDVATAQNYHAPRTFVLPRRAMLGVKLDF